MELLKNKLRDVLLTLTQPKETVPGHIDPRFFAKPITSSTSKIRIQNPSPNTRITTFKGSYAFNYNSNSSSGYISGGTGSSSEFSDADILTCCDYHSGHFSFDPKIKSKSDNNIGSKKKHKLPQSPTAPLLAQDSNNNEEQNLNIAHRPLSPLLKYEYEIPGHPVFELISPQEYSGICRLRNKGLLISKFGKRGRKVDWKIEIRKSIGLGMDFKKSSRSVYRIAFNSRILLLLIQIFARKFLSSHPNDGFRASPGIPKLLDPFVKFLFGGLVNWDGQYFLHITTNGYTHENTMAFFPLLPMIIGIPTQLLYLFLFPILSPQAIAILLCWILNNGLFLLTAQTLYKIAKLHKINSNFEKYVVYLFCFNPASIFFSAYYSESLFSWATFNCILWIYKRKLFRAILFASLSSITRSNGLLNFGIIFSFLIGEILDLLKNSSYYKYFPTHMIPIVIRKGSYFVPALVPFVLFQIFCQYKFCYIYGPNYKEPGPGFCDSIFSMPYAYIQKSNWDVGFLRYFQLKQIPNFVLAFPTLYILGTECWRKWIQYRKQVFSRPPKSNECRYQHLGDFGLVLHGLFLTLFCFFCVHVQISTRMIFSSCPYLYIFIAKQLRQESTQLVKRQRNWLPYYTGICLWFGSYFLIGTIAFSLGYPWT